MKKSRTKGIIYFRTFGAFLAIYIILMLAFSAYLVEQEKKAAGIELETFALQVNRRVEEILQNYLDAEGRITDTSKVKQELLMETPFFTRLGSELAIFTGDYKLLFNTNNYWHCSYTKYKEGNRHYIAGAYLNPRDWFSKEEVKELEEYLYADPKPKKIGDLAGYSLTLEGLWVDNGMIIPKKITVTPMYAQKFNEQGEVISSGGERTGEIVYVTGYQNAKDLPYFEHAGIIPYISGNPGSQKRTELRQMVRDQAKLMAAVDQFSGLESLIQRVGFLTYRYYLPVPYQNTVRVKDDQSLESAFWTVLGRNVNIGERCFATLAFVWLACLITFSGAALILARQTYKTYRQQEEAEKQRRELTDALAHDLKTPLSIISGYAQNLLENVQITKREYYASQIQTNVNRMDKIIHQMLELTRLESDYLQINLQNVALAEICREVIERYKLVWEEKMITTSLDGEAVIKADYPLMLRVIDNFFTNALDNTPEGGKIRIKILDDTLEIYNSGSHIPENKMEEIWLPFKKGDAERSHSRGTGLGLAIIRAILDLHSFSYGAHNKEDGVVFWFRFS